MKKRIILILFIVLIFSIVLLFIFLPKKENHKKNTNSKKTKVETKVDKFDKKEDKKDELEFETIEVKEDINKDDNNNTEKKDENVITNQQPEEPVYVAPVVEQPQTQVVQPEPIPISQPEPQSQPVVQQNNIWDELGITEYEYYHSPMWSWARVDFKIEDYGTFEATHQACIDAGYNTKDYFSFSCSNINSYSGDYLGDMLEVTY